MTRPRLTRSIPFWVLVAGSLASVVAGGLLVVDKLGTMAATLTDGTATVDVVYVGQIWAVLGAILVGAGLIGLALALTLGVLRSFSPVAPLEVVDAPAFVEEPVDEPAVAEAVEAVEAVAPEAEAAATR